MPILESGRRAPIAALAAAIFVATAAGAVHAQDKYPSSTVEVVVPFAAGGAVDVTGRLVAKALSQGLHGNFIVVNKPGANSNIGNLEVARAKPDGYTLLVSSIGLAANKALYKKLDYDPLTDLEPVSLVSDAPVGLFVNKSLPVNNLKEFMVYAKAHPGALNFASYGVGSSPHLAAELFAHETGVKMVHVPFNGNGPATMATVSNTTQVIFCSTVAALPHVLNGSLKAIAFAGEQRSKQLPNVPTFKEAGLDFTMGTWFGLLAPAKTPRGIVDALNKALKKSLDDPEFNRIAESQGAKVVASSPEEFATFLKTESARLSKVIREANIGAR
jgi:tripartite-type tricarboxylate transporter receptor subunit TctC